jgi:hypothetical protein
MTMLPPNTSLEPTPLALAVPLSRSASEFRRGSVLGR